MIDEESDLELCIRKSEDMITCDNKKCEIRGDYWKCYIGNQNKCQAYLSWYIRKKEK